MKRWLAALDLRTKSIPGHPCDATRTQHPHWYPPWSGRGWPCYCGRNRLQVDIPWWGRWGRLNGTRTHLWWLLRRLVGKMEGTGP